MLRLLRIALLIVLTMVVLSVIIVVGSPETGPAEKGVLVGVLVGLFALAVPIRRIGAVTES